MRKTPLATLSLPRASVDYTMAAAVFAGKMPQGGNFAAGANSASPFDLCKRTEKSPPVTSTGFTPGVGAGSFGECL
jgi:hypothetical protein